VDENGNKTYFDLSNETVEAVSDLIEDVTSSILSFAKNLQAQN